MNDNELRTAAEEVARALGLCTKVYCCPDCVQHFPKRARIIAGEGGFCGQCGRFWSKDWPYAEAPLDLLTDAGAARLLTLLSEWRIGVNLDYVTNSERKAITLYFGGEPPFATTEGRGDTWPAALVLAARVALRAGWLEEEGGDG